MKNQKAKIILRVLLGLIFLVFGLNKFLNFLPGLEYEEGSTAAVFLNGLFQTPYFSVLLPLTEIIVGLSLLTGLYVPLFLLVLAPVTLNAMLFHLTLDLANGLPAFLAFFLNWTLMFIYKDHYRPLLISKINPPND